jgi:hypothetical protein
MRDHKVRDTDEKRPQSMLLPCRLGSGTVAPPTEHGRGVISCCAATREGAARDKSGSDWAAR